MKKFFVTGMFLFAAIAADAQTLYTADGTLTANRTVTLNRRFLNFQAPGGNLFIHGTSGFVGVNTTTPSFNLDVKGKFRADEGYFTKSTANGQNFATNNDRIIASLVFSAGTSVDPLNQCRTMTFMDMPQSNMDVAPTIWFNLDNRDYMTRFRFRAVQGGDSQFVLFDKTQTENLLVNDDGNDNITFRMPKANSRMCIGTTSYTDGNDVYSLSVNGNVRADRVKVYNTWADYVFEDNYDLPTLEEVEAHINEKGHLKDIPSAKEVEANGIDLGEMNKLLLQKIEELTLYTIELNKEVKALKGQINKK